MSDLGRRADRSAYTPPTMETGIRGDRRAAVDALYTEAQQALSQSANRLRALTGKLRRNQLLSLDIQGQGKRTVMVKDMQSHPVKRVPTHVDFIETAPPRP